MKKVLIFCMIISCKTISINYSIEETNKLLSQLELTLKNLSEENTPDAQALKQKLSECVSLSQQIKENLPSEDLFSQTIKKDEELSELCNQIKSKEYARKKSNKIGIWISGGAAAIFATLYLALKDNLQSNNNIVSKALGKTSWFNTEIMLKLGIIGAAIFFVATIWNKISEYFFENKDTQNHLAKAQVYSELYREKLDLLEQQVGRLSKINQETSGRVFQAIDLINNKIVPQIAILLDMKAESARLKMSKSGNKGKAARQKHKTCKLQLENLVGELPITQARLLQLKTIKLASSPQDKQVAGTSTP